MILSINEQINSFTKNINSVVEVINFSVVVFNEIMFLIKGSTEVGLVSFEVVISSSKGDIFRIEFSIEGNNVGFTISNSLGEFLDVRVDDFNVVEVVKGLLAIVGVFTFLSCEELSAKVVESDFEVIQRVVKLGGKSDHLFHGTSHGGLFHLFVDLLNHHLLLGGLGSDSEGTLEEDCSQN